MSSFRRQRLSRPTKRARVPSVWGWTKTSRAVWLALLIALAFSALGALQFAKPPKVLSKPPFDLDLALRALSLGWFEPDDTLPVTLVDIDEQTYQSWNAPAVTPPDALVQMLQVVSSASPAAIVIDIDLSWGVREDPPASEGATRLRDFLEHYRGEAPLIFPKRIEPSAGDTRRIAESPFDPLFVRNGRLAWAHANFTTDSAGKVRWSSDWLEVCTEHGPEWLPSVPVRLAAVLPSLPPRLERPLVPARSRQECAPLSAQSPPRRRLLIGPPLTGAAAAAPPQGVQVVSASMLITPRILRDDERLFRSRVVLIGASHSGSADQWLTPSGVRTGVELLTNAVRYSPLQSALTGLAAELRYRAGALLLFAAFVFFDRRFRALIALASSIGTAIVFTAVWVRLFGDLRAFDAIEAAILMMVIYKALKAIIDLADEIRARRRLFPKGWRGALLTMRAAFMKPDPTDGGH